MKRFLSLLAFLLPLAVSAQTNVVDQVVWVVGNEPILLSDVEDARVEMEAYGQQVDDPYCSIPEQIAIQKLYIHQAELDSVDVSESYAIQEANAKIDYAIQQYGSKENLELASHRTVAQLRELYKEMARTNQKMQGVRQNLTKNIKVTPAEVREYYKHMNPDSIPMIPAQVEVQIITSQPHIVRAEVERVEGKLKDIARRVNAGETTFATQARLWSQDPGSAVNGGECGFKKRNEFVEEFSNVAFAMTDPKKVSKIVKTEYGYHIIQLIEKKGDMVNVRHILIKPEISDSTFTACTSRLDSIADDIREGKFTFEEAAARLSDDKNTRANQGLMYKRNMYGQPESARFEMKDLPQDIALAVDTMKVGDISRAFRYTNEKGQELAAVVRLKNRIAPHRATPVEDFQILSDIVYNERAQEKINKWITEKIKSTYVRVSPDWRGCKFQYEGWIR